MRSLPTAHRLDLAAGLKRKGHILIKRHTVRPGRRVGRLPGVNAPRAQTCSSCHQACSRLIRPMKGIPASLHASRVRDPAEEWYLTECLALQRGVVSHRGPR